MKEGYAIIGGVLFVPLLLRILYLLCNLFYTLRMNLFALFDAVYILLALIGAVVLVCGHYASKREV